MFGIYAGSVSAKVVRNKVRLDMADRFYKEKSMSGVATAIY